MSRSTLVARLGNDPRTVLMGPGVLLLQVAHPVVGAGVAEHSDYRRDPFGRLGRTLGAIAEVAYGDEDASTAAGRQVRSFHRSITGTLPDGSRYAAFDPEAWAWVHATLGWGMQVAGRTFGRPLDEVESARLWDEWLEVGDRLHVRPGDLPAAWRDVPGYVDAMVADRLERTVAFDSVMTSFHRVPRPSALPMPFTLWNGLAIPVTVPLSVLAVGTVPASARDKLGLAWTPAHRQAFWTGCTALRAFGPVATRLARQSRPALAG